MSDEWFTGVDFDEVSYDRHFKQVHSADAGYQYIEHLTQNIESIPKENSQLAGYARIDVLRASMQYCEEFMIYMLSYINEDESFVEDLIRNDIRDFCEKYDSDNLDAYYDDPSFSFDDRLRSVFGYEEILSAENPADTIETETEDDLDNDQIAAEIEGSVETIRSMIGEIASFYTNFIDMYNSIKHGNKYIVHDHIKLTIGDDERDFYEGDQSFATFLCKTSAERDQGRPYVVNYPIEFMSSQCVSAVEKVNQLFSYMELVFDERAQGSEKVTIGRFSRENTSQGAESSQADNAYTEVWNADSKTILSRTGLLTEFLPSSDPKIACRISTSGKSVKVETNGDTEKSEKYPVLISLSQRSSPGARLDISYDFSFNMSIMDIDFRQLRDWMALSQMAKEGNLSRIVIKLDGENNRIDEPISGFTTPAVPDEFDKDTIEAVALAQKITQEYLPLPPFLLDGQSAVIMEAVSNSPERTEVQDAIAQAREIGDGRDYTTIIAEDTDDGNGQQILDHHAGFISTELLYNPDNSCDEIEQLAEAETDGEQSTISLEQLLESEVTDTSDIQLQVPFMDGSYEDLLREIKDEGATSLYDSINAVTSQEGDKENPEEPNFIIRISIEYKYQTYWYDVHRLVIRELPQPDS